MSIIDGKLVSNHIRELIKVEIEQLKQKQIVPGLAVVIIGENPASKSYVRSKEKACIKLGMHSEKYELDKTTSESELLNLIQKLNKDEKIHGILVQLPLPEQINTEHIIEAIDPRKDVDGFHPVNVGKHFSGLDAMKPCTPYGIMKLLSYYKLEVEGKHAVVLGRSNIVGKPIANMLLAKNATVSMCHSRTKNLKEMLLMADIVVVAIGRPHFVTADMIKEGAVVIDVGINRIESGIVGDVDFEAIKDKAGYITPVPGGVGPMTITMLMYNTLEAAKKIAFDGK